MTNLKMFDCLYMLFRETPKEQILANLEITESEFNEIILQWGMDEPTLKDLSAKSENIGKKFMQNTRYVYMSDSDQEKGVQCPPAFRKLDGSIFQLPAAKECEIPSADLFTIMDQRRSVRTYDDHFLTINELSFLLWSTQGVRMIRQNEKISLTLRTVPSAGARHALETYLMINNVEGIPSGLYYYDAQDHHLVQLHTQPDIVEYVSQACWEQPMIKTAAVTFIWVAIPYRMSWRYGERTWRYLHLDAGHVCQNLYLASESIDSGVCAIGAYSDELFAILLDLDIDKEFVIYAATVGKKQV